MGTYCHGTGQRQRGYEFGTAGRSAFAQDYGVLETITKIEPAEKSTPASPWPSKRVPRDR
jgi:hypothetical protein